MKKNIQTMKEDIKVMASQQKIAKQNRKTVNFKGIRTMSPYEAAYSVIRSKHALSSMYIAYAQLRGKDPSLFYPDWKLLHSAGEINKILANYPYEEEVIHSDS